MAGALKTFQTHNFKRRVYMEEQKAQQDKRFVEGRQNAYMIFDYVKISGTGEALVDCSDFTRVQLNKDSVQGFDSTPNGTK